MRNDCGGAHHETKAIEDRTNMDQDEKKKLIVTVSERLGERLFGRNSLLDLIVLDCY
jgi:hypothetical protein